MAEQNISFWPDDFVQGGLLQDVDVLIKEAVWEIFDYQGKANVANPPCSLKMTLQPVGSEETHEDFISCGPSSDWVPNPETNGDTIAAVGTGTTLKKGSNFHLFVESLKECGMPKALLAGGKASALVGLVFHLDRPVRPKMAGIEDKNASGREKTYIKCSKIISLPGEGKGKPKAGGAAAAANAGKATSGTPAGAGGGKALSGDDLSAFVLEKVVNLLETEGTVQMTQVRAKVLPQLKELAATSKAAVHKLVADADWYTNNGLTVTEEGMVSM